MIDLIDLAPQPQDTAVEFRGLRFAYSFLASGNNRASSALPAWVYVTPSGAIDAMVMNNRLQK